MLNHHLPQLFSHLSAVGRDAANYCHAAIRSLLLGLVRAESPRTTFRLVLQQSRGGMRGDEPFFIHYHIFKNAGSSFEWALKAALGPAVERMDQPRADGFIPAREIIGYARDHPKIKAVSSHQASPPAPRIPGRRVLTSILIRDPIARIRSIYAFERRQKSEARGAIKAKELDFKGYVEWRLKVTPRMFCNYQVAFCSRTDNSGRAICDRSDLARAIAVLDSIDIVGTVERYPEFLTLAQSVLSESFGPTALVCAHRNRSRDVSDHSAEKILQDLMQDLGPELARELLRQNEMDMCLHQVADALLSRRLAERLIALKLRDACGALEASPEVADSSQPPLPVRMSH